MTTEQNDDTARFKYIVALAIPGIMAMVALAIMLGGLFPMLSLRYERAAIGSGEVWRIFTGHFAHLDWNHLLINLGGLALIWLLFGHRLAITQWLIVIFTTMIMISAALWFFHPALTWYVGLSGLLHGMFVAGALGGIFAGYRAEWLLLALVVAKLGWEQYAGALPGEVIESGFIVVHAHLYGAVAGLATVLLLRLILPLPEWRR